MQSVMLQAGTLLGVTVVMLIALLLGVAQITQWSLMQLTRLLPLLHPLWLATVKQVALVKPRVEAYLQSLIQPSVKHCGK